MEAATEINACLESSTGGAYPCRAYAILKHWYQHASARSLNLSQTDMEKVRGDFQTLYQREKTPPPGPSLSTHNEPIKVNEDIPSEAEVEAAVRRLHPHRLGGYTHLRLEHFKKWRREAYLRDQPKTPPRRGSTVCAWYT